MRGEANIKYLPKNVWRLLKKGHPFHAFGFLVSVIVYWFYAAAMVIVITPAYLFQRFFEWATDGYWLYAPSTWLSQYYRYLHQLVKESHQ
jgi:hypothetical protein